MTANSSQEVVEGQPIADIVYELNEVAMNAVVEDLPEGLSYIYDAAAKTVTIYGTPTAAGTFKLTVTGDEFAGVKPVTTTGVITLVTPFKVLTGDWYHFQDDWDALPTDLQGVLEMIQGDSNASTGDGTHLKGDTYVDPEKVETASGFSSGAVCLGESNGGIKLNLADGVLQLKLNIYFTGKRTFNINWTNADNTTGSKTTSQYAKGAYTIDLVELAGLSEKSAKQLRNISIAQKGANGGARIYDMYVRVPIKTNGIQDVKAVDQAERTVKLFQNGRLVIVKNGTKYNAIGQVVK